MTTLVECDGRKKAFKGQTVRDVRQQVAAWLPELQGASTALEFWDDFWGDYVEKDDDAVLEDKVKARVRHGCSTASSSSVQTGRFVLCRTINCHYFLKDLPYLQLSA